MRCISVLFLFIVLTGCSLVRRGDERTLVVASSSVVVEETDKEVVIQTTPTTNPCGQTTITVKKGVAKKENGILKTALSLGAIVWDFIGR